MPDYKGDRQTSNLALIHQQINWLQQQPDGILFQQNSGDNCIAVKKIKSVLLLLLADTETLITNVAQSILALNNPLNLIFPYLRATLLALAWKNQQKKIYIIGFGGAASPDYFTTILLRQWSNVQILTKQ